MRKAVVDKISKKVMNVINLDDDANFTPPLECLIVASENADIGEIYDSASGSFSEAAA